MSDGKLRFRTQAIRRELPSDHHEMAPVTEPSIVSYGSENRTAMELQLALSELATEARPQTVARYLLPDGVRLEDIEVLVGRPELPGRLGRKLSITVTVAIVPEPRPDAGPAGHWVFIPALEHACYVDRTESIPDRVAAELAVLPAALALDADGWRRLLSYAPARLEEVVVELSTTPLAEIQGRKALAEAERRRVATATLDHAGRRLEGAEPGAAARRARGAARRARADPRRAGAPRRPARSARRPPADRARRRVGERARKAPDLGHLGRRAGRWRERARRVAGARRRGARGRRGARRDPLLRRLRRAVRRPPRRGRHRSRRRAAPPRRRRPRAHDRRATPVALDRAERRDVSLVGSMLRVTVPPTDPETTTAACGAWVAH